MQMEETMRFHKWLLSIAAFLALTVFAFLHQGIIASSYVLPFRDVQLSLIYLAQGTGFFLSALLGGYAAEHWGKRHIIVLGCFLMALGAVGFGAFSNSLGPLIASVVLFGCGGGLVEGMATSIVGDLHPQNRRSAINALQVAFGIGAIVGPDSIGRLIEAGLPWKWSFFSGGAVCILFSLLFLASRFPSGETTGFHLDEVKAILRSRTFQICSVLIILYVAAEACLSGWMVRFLRDEHAAAASIACRALGFFWLGMVASRIGSTFLPRSVPSFKVLAVVFLGSAALVFGMALSPTAGLVLILVLLAGFFFGPGWGTIASIAVDHFPARSGAVAGAMASLGALGSMIGQPSGGIVAESLGLRWSIVLSAVIMLGGFFVLLRWRKAI